MAIFVLLSAEIESLRSRVLEKQKEVDEVRKSIVSSCKNFGSGGGRS